MNVRNAKKVGTPEVVIAAFRLVRKQSPDFDPQILGSRHAEARPSVVSFVTFRDGAGRRLWLV